MTGPARVYFHGLPGSPEELKLFGTDRSGQFDWIPDRNRLAFGSGYFDRIAAEIRTRFSGRRVNITGFSLGAHCALQVASRLPDRVGRLELISAAGPLEFGDFLDEMAGGKVFKLAKTSARLFSALVAAQSVAAKFAPATLAGLLFATAQGRDRELAVDSKFKAAMAEILRSAFSGGAGAYRGEISTYVQPWSQMLRTVACPVRLWHGTMDNWSPPHMAVALADALPNADCVMLQGLSHYSTLDYVLHQAADV